MSEERIIYNGVNMHPEWPAKIEESQQQPTYTINGVPIGRVKIRRRN